MTLAYDAANRITGISETGLPAKSFGYDALDRLTGYTSGGTALTYHYDPDGNRTSLAGSASVAYTIAAASNRLVVSKSGGTRSLGYDAAGDMTVDNRGVTILGYTYDASGRLVAAKTGAYTTLYTNDGLGQRATRSGYGASGIAGDLERFVYDEAGQLLGEYDGAGKAIEETVWLGDLPVAVLIPGKLPYYIAPDQLGAPHQIASAARSTVWHLGPRPVRQRCARGQPRLQPPLPRPVLRQGNRPQPQRLPRLRPLYRPLRPKRPDRPRRRAQSVCVCRGKSDQWLRPRRPPVIAQRPTRRRPAARIHLKHATNPHPAASRRELHRATMMWSMARSSSAPCSTESLTGCCPTTQLLAVTSPFRYPSAVRN